MINKSRFVTLENRLKLLYRLKEDNFYVRMHAYEYIVGTGDRIVAIIFLEPSRNLAEVLQLERASKCDIERVVTAIKDLDPTIRVIVKSPKVVN